MSQMHALGNFWYDLAGVILRRFGVILGILECRITLCDKTCCLIRKRLNTSVVSDWLQFVLSSNRLAFCTSLKQIHLSLDEISISIAF